jgi:tetratricopeptide (TPR) repeat protein
MPLICATCQSQAPHGSHTCLYCGASLISKRNLGPATTKSLPQLQARGSSPKTDPNTQMDPLSSHMLDIDDGLDTIRSVPSSLLVHNEMDHEDENYEYEYDLSLSDSDIELIEAHEEIKIEELTPMRDDSIVLIEDESEYEIPIAQSSKISGEFVAWSPQQTMDESLDGLPRLADFEGLSASMNQGNQKKPARRVHLTDLKTPISSIPIEKHRHQTTTNEPVLSSSSLRYNRTKKKPAFTNNVSTEILSRTHQNDRYLSLKAWIIFIIGLFGLSGFILMNPNFFSKILQVDPTSRVKKLSIGDQQNNHHQSPNLDHIKTTPAFNTYGNEALTSEVVTNKQPPKVIPLSVVKPLSISQQMVTDYHQALIRVVDHIQNSEKASKKASKKISNHRQKLEWQASIYMALYEMSRWQNLPHKKEWLTSAQQLIQQAQLLKSSHQQMILKIRRAIVQKRMELAKELMSEYQELSKGTWLVGNQMKSILPFIKIFLIPPSQRSSYLKMLLNSTKSKSSTLPIYALMYTLQNNKQMVTADIETVSSSKNNLVWESLYNQAVKKELEKLTAYFNQSKVHSSKDYQITKSTQTSSRSSKNTESLKTVHESADHSQLSEAKAKAKAKAKKKRSKINSYKKINNLSIEELYKKGNKFLDLGKTQQARSYFGRILELNPNHVNALAQLAWCAVDELRFLTAKGIFKQVLRKSAHHADSIYGMGYVLEKMGDKTSARMYFEKYLQRYPKRRQSNIVKRKLSNLSRE